MGFSNTPISIARLIRTRGIHGEIEAELLTDFPERFASVRSVTLSGRGHSQPAVLESYRFQKKRVVLKFRGCTTPEAARRLVGCEVQIPAGEAVALAPNTYFDFDLIGCTVRDLDGVLVGSVESIFRGSGDCSNLVVSTPQGKEVMIPLVDQFLKRVDIKRKEIVVDLPEELRRLNS